MFTFIGVCTDFHIALFVVYLGGPQCNLEYQPAEPAFETTSGRLICSADEKDLKIRKTFPDQIKKAHKSKDPVIGTFSSNPFPFHWHASNFSPFH